MPRFSASDQTAQGVNRSGGGGQSGARVDLVTLDRVKLTAAELRLPRGTVRVKDGCFQWAAAAAGPAGPIVQAATAAKGGSGGSGGQGAKAFCPANTPALPAAPANSGKEAALDGAEGVAEVASVSAPGVEAAKGGGDKGKAGGAKLAVAWRLRLRAFEVAPGTLVAVTGQVGSGKSSFLAALLGELDPTEVSSRAPATSSFL